MLNCSSGPHIQDQTGLRMDLHCKTMMPTDDSSFYKWHKGSGRKDTLWMVTLEDQKDFGGNPVYRNRCTSYKNMINEPFILSAVNLCTDIWHWFLWQKKNLSRGKATKTTLLWPAAIHYRAHWFSISTHKRWLNQPRLCSSHVWRCNLN